MARTFTTCTCAPVCAAAGAYSSTISYAATVGSASYSLLAQSFLANTITANVLINQIPLTCGGTITLVRCSRVQTLFYAAERSRRKKS